MSQIAYLQDGLVPNEEACREHLLHFIQNNWLGPYEALPENLETLQKTNREEILKSLISDGEYPYRLVRDPLLLLLALKQGVEGSWWGMRALFCHQRILEEPSAALKEKIYAVLANLESFLAEFGPSLYVEAALIYQFYHDEKLATEALESACQAIGFSHSLTGVLGRRTKFQTFDTAQLVVQTQSSNTSSTDLLGQTPKDVQLNDDVLLERPALETDLSKDLSYDELAILLAQAQHFQNFHAKDAVIIEKALAYVSRVLERPNTWCIYSTGLFLRSRLEAGKVRSMERATLQIQALVDQIGLVEPKVEERLPYFFTVALPSPWEMDRVQGYLFASLGAFKTALEIFDRRELWDEAISCLVQLGDVSGAEGRIRAELEKMPENPKLWCLLGDIKEDDPSFYEKAWEISGKRYSRAQRSIGKIHFRKQEWTQCIECYELALAINPLFVKTWFLLGCAALQVDDFKKATHAFSRVVTLAPENSEAWNNLASIHLEQDRPRDALMALKEAARLDYDNVRIWENYFEVALQSGELLLAVNALRRVAEVQEKQFDLRKYQRLVALLAKAIQFVGAGEFEVQSVKKRCLALVDEVLSVSFASSPDLWISQARLAALFKEGQKELLMKAYRAAKALPFSRDQAAFEKLVTVLTDLKDIMTSSEDERFQFELMIKDVRAAVSYPENLEAMAQLNAL